MQWVWKAQENETSRAGHRHYNMYNSSPYASNYEGKDTPCSHEVRKINKIAKEEKEIKWEAKISRTGQESSREAEIRSIPVNGTLV